MLVTISFFYSQNVFNMLFFRVFKSQYCVLKDWNTFHYFTPTSGNDQDQIAPFTT